MDGRTFRLGPTDWLVETDDPVGVAAGLRALPPPPPEVVRARRPPPEPPVLVVLFVPPPPPVLPRLLVKVGVGAIAGIFWLADSRLDW